MIAETDDIKSLIAAQAADYFVVRGAGRTSEADDRAFLEWLRTSPVHVAEYLSIAMMAKDARAAARLLGVPVETLIADARSDGEVVPLRIGRVAKPEGRPWVRYAAGVAAAGMVAMAAGAVWLWSAAAGDVYATARGEQRILQLSDTTVVRLDSDSAIAVTFTGRRRLIDLVRGQAYFEVAEDAARPFQVRAGGAVIDDVGTVFDVFRKSSDTVITVIDGVVKVHEGPPDAGNQSADLRAGDQATVLSSGEVETKKLGNLQKTTAWIRDEIVFDGESVASVVAEFNRYNRIQIVVDDPAVAALPISGVFRTFDVTSFTEFLSSLPNVQILKSDRLVTVSGTVSGAARRDR